MKLLLSLQAHAAKAGIPVASLLVALAALAAGCGGDAVQCGNGTVRKGDACVPAGTLSCGAGTHAVDGACVADEADSVDSDTAGEDGAGGDTSGGDTSGGDTAGGDTSGGDTSGGDTATDTGGCVPTCGARVCGDNGCGGTCGSCSDPAKPNCDDLTGTCVAVCVPSCMGKSCGDDGCGGSCGTCSDGITCTAGGHCVPPAWTCDAAWFDANDACDCGCGAPDPDCGKAGLLTAGCDTLSKCDEKGTCVSKIPAAWTCNKTAYDALDACDCGCGAPDPDCAYTGLPLLGCSGTGDTCKDGVCGACVPSCKDAQGKTKACGGDGCGGLCGLCNVGSATLCQDGACIDPCKPTPVACATATCGSDGCGGSCGACAKGSECKAGQCVALPSTDPNFSCKGNCLSTAKGGCSCAKGCKAQGNCCADYEEVCVCKPDCTGRVCGNDGCGGSCGTCPAGGKACDDKGQCTATCKPNCTGKGCGDDGCGGSCGSCTGEAVCGANFQCVPKTWTCNPSLYGDKQGCECGCGAQDLDCKDAKMATYGCPTAATTCGDKGVCDITFCTANSACKDAWCVGLYHQGGARYAGSCAVPVGGTVAPGGSCSSGGACSTGVCIDGLCRSHCGKDGDCPSSQICAGLGVPYNGKSVDGLVAVCTNVLGSADACKAQADCAASGESCVAVVDATTLGPRYVCSAPPAAPKIGVSCAANACPSWQFCATAAKGPVCAPFCPGGQGDCPSGWTCQQQAMHDAGTLDPGDDPKVSVCVPN